MKTKYQIQIHIHNWEGGNHVVTQEITENDIARFTPLIIAINQNKGNKNWNWFGKKGLPDKWDGKNFVLDMTQLVTMMKENFDWNMYDYDDVNLVKEFFLRFTPYSADGIGDIEIYKVEKVELN